MAQFRRLPSQRENEPAHERPGALPRPLEAGIWRHRERFLPGRLLLAVAGCRASSHSAKDGEAVMSFGCTGGHFQPTGQIQILSNILDYGMSMQQAIEHPRMFARSDSLELEQTVPSHVWEGLRQRGHNPTPTVNPLGTCHAIWRDESRGVFFGGSDGRRDGLAIGY